MTLKIGLIYMSEGPPQDEDSENLPNPKWHELYNNEDMHAAGHILASVSLIRIGNLNTKDVPETSSIVPMMQKRYIEIMVEGAEFYGVKKEYI